MHVHVSLFAVSVSKSLSIFSLKEIISILLYYVQADAELLTLWFFYELNVYYITIRIHSWQICMHCFSRTWRQISKCSSYEQEELVHRLESLLPSAIQKQLLNRHIRPVVNIYQLFLVNASVCSSHVICSLLELLILPSCRSSFNQMRKSIRNNP